MKQKIIRKKLGPYLLMLINKENKKNTDFPEKLIDNHGRECIKSEIPERFNIFFATIGEQLDKGIPVTDGNPLDYLQNYQNRDVWEVSEVTCGKIENIIRCLNKVGGGIDKISTYILSNTYKTILQHITLLFSLCLRSGIFPDNMKSAVITPIYKSGGKDMFTNYRPISLLPTLSKVLEKIIYSELSSFLDHYRTLHPLQFGFRKKHSTYMPIAHMYDEIVKNLQENYITCTIYLDLKKAFDTVSIPILLAKLQVIGIKGRLFEIIRSYLQN